MTFLFLQIIDFEVDILNYETKLKKVYSIPSTSKNSIDF